MTRRDVNEGDVFRKGFATNALEDGATTGQVPAISADGQMEFVDAGGGSLPDWWTIDDTPTDPNAVVVRLDLPQAVQDWLDDVANVGEIFGAFRDGTRLWSFDGNGNIRVGSVFLGFLQADEAAITSYRSTIASDAIVTQGSGTVNKTAPGADPECEYRWNLVEDRVQCDFDLLFAAGTAGQAGQPIFITLPSLPAPRPLRGTNAHSCGVAHTEVGGSGQWGFVEVQSVANQARIAIDKTDTLPVGATETLGSGDRIAGHFSYSAIA